MPIKPSNRIYKIGLSPGHGGADSGAVSPHGLKEAVLARKVCAFLKESLNKNPAFDVVVHDYGINCPKNYYGRVKKSDARAEDYYCPIHFNSTYSTTNANGWLVFVCEEQAKKDPALFEFCKVILDHLQNAYNIGFRDWDGNRDGFMAGIGRQVYESSAPKAQTIYFELGFLSNLKWELRLHEEEVLKNIANAIARAFEIFLIEKNKV